jgi:prevent-host-death family protein
MVRLFQQIQILKPAKSTSFVLSWLQLDGGEDVQEIGAFEAKNTLGSLLDRVERGEEIVITRHGKPVARLVASAPGIDRARAKAAAERIRSRAERLSSERFDWGALKTDRDEGRP